MHREYLGPGLGLSCKLNLLVLVVGLHALLNLFVLQLQQLTDVCVLGTWAYLHDVDHLFVVRLENSVTEANCFVRINLGQLVSVP